MIPNPINIDKLKKPDSLKRDKIYILHAINSKNKIKKGNKFFDKSLSIIEKKYSDKIRLLELLIIPIHHILKTLKIVIFFLTKYMLMIKVIMP